jgi:hypothetical protein
MKEDQELIQFRTLMLPPNTWESGFNLKTMIGGLFVGVVMAPASIYMSLVMGADIGPAAQWVTIILFIEVARRSFTTLKRPEIFILYYMAGAILSINGGNLLYRQFLVQSESFRQLGLADKIPSWVVPSSPAVLGTRSFFNRAWFLPIALAIVGQILARLDQFGLGYILYRLTSDVEKLPFPMAPVGALGITALADASSGEETWRWRVFSFGAMLGIAFAAIYVALPSISGALLPKAISIFPIPWTDLTTYSERALPAVPLILSFDLGLVISGMVLPFWAMMGSFLGLVLITAANPVLYHAGILHTWKPGVGAVMTINSNLLDFYLSWSIGLACAIAVIGFFHVAASLLRRRNDMDATARTTMDWRTLFRPPQGRGDISIWLAFGFYVLAATVNILVACWLLNMAHAGGMGSAVTTTLVLVFCFYALIYTPFVNYVMTRMEGIVGMTVQVPFVREAAFILSGYKGAAIWFTQFPGYNYASQALYFRQTELIGTKISSLLKAEIFILPIIVLTTLVFSQFVWHIAPIPSGAFPYTQKMWEVLAFRDGITISSTLPGNSHGPFFEAFVPAYILAGLLIALLAYFGLSFFGLPILLVYGLIRGMDGSLPNVILPQFLGALLGRYYFSRKFGSNWPKYRVVFFAGFSCGVGLIGMLSLGIVFMSKSVIQSQY